MKPIPTLPLPSGEQVPILGQGTWNMGEEPRSRQEEVAALRLSLDLGMSLIDTAEMYADGGAEEVVAEAMAGRREEVFLVSKVLPANATRRGTVEACERSLKRLRTDRIDLYLLHWRGRTPLAETLEGLERLVASGKARHGATAAQVALAWLLRQSGLLVIPKAGRAEHVRENRAALELQLTEQDLAELNREFPAPTRKRPLEML